MSTHPSSTADWEPPSPEALQAMLPQYEITAIIGRGGMGAVYRGRQAKLDRDVAIKLLPETLSEDAEELNFAARFEQEAKAMAKLDHPAIISVYDFGETSEGQLYFVMEFIEGMDIHQYLNHHGGKLSQEDALAIIAHVLDALDYAHSHGIVHRDIKPANILLNHEGRVKVADFGLAKKLAPGEDDGPALTMSNVAVGTPDFVAPEALDSSAMPDHRADLYAVGVMLYQLLTGKLPRGQFKLPSELVPDLDPRLDEIVNFSLQPDPEERYASASAVRSALDPIFTTPVTKVEGQEEVSQGRVPQRAEAPKPSEKKAKSKMPLWIGVGVAALLVIGVIVLLTQGGSEEDAPAVAVEEPVMAKSESPPTMTKSKSGQKGSSKAKGSKGKAAAVTPEPQPATPVEIVSETPVEMPAPESDAADEAEATVVEVETEAARDSAETDAAVNPLLEIAGLETRIGGYLAARSTQVSALTDSYLRGLDTRLNQAADAGNLELVKDYQAEKEAVGALQQSLSDSSESWLEAMENRPSLSELPGDALEELQSLRGTWNTERKKIANDLDGKLQQSLQALGAELTKAREFDQAELVMAYRDSLVGESEAAAPNDMAATEEPGESVSREAVSSPATEPIQGRLRTIGTYADGKAMDISAAEGITDFIEVYGTNGYYLALRANGELVSNFPPLQEVEATGIARLARPHNEGTPDCVVGFDAEGRARMLYTVGPGRFLDLIDQPVRDALVSKWASIALLEDGSLRWHGQLYMSGLGKSGAIPPEEAREGIVDIAMNTHGPPGARWVAVLTEKGKIILWNDEGEVELPQEMQTDVQAIVTSDQTLTFLKEDGTVSGYSGKKGVFSIVEKARDIRSGLFQSGGVAQSESGAWSSIAVSDEGRSIDEKLKQLPPLGPRQFDYIRQSGRAVSEAVIWIEPVEE